MDAHSISFTSVAQRSTSRIWQDLVACRAFTQAALQPQQGMSGLVEGSSGMKQRQSAPSDRKPHVGIVGAGLSGLRCADILLQHGFEVTILEGRDRVGGRVHQQRMLAGYLVDAGPNWIHGTSDNPILDIAKKTNTAIGTWDSTTSVFDDAGNALSQTEAEVYSTIMWDIVEAAFRHSNQHSASIKPDESLWDFFQTEVAKRIPDTKPDYQRKRENVFQIAESWGAFVGSHIFNQSLKYFWLEECIEGENLFCAGTYEKILEAIAAPAIVGARVELNTVVRDFHYGDNSSNSSVFVNTTTGRFHFDEVVCTTPLGWLKQNTKSFHPSLPSRFLQAVNDIGYGCLEKVYISFATSFWANPDEGRSKVQGFCQWLRPKYATDTNPHKWNQEIVEMACLNSATAHPTLLFYMYGDQSRHLTKQSARFSTSEERDDFLYRWFKPYYSRLPGYNEMSEDCKTTGCFATSWLSDDLAGNGSYSNFQVGLENGDKDIEIMREGCPDRGLWFAGEHTAPFVALGTATGAYWSGESVAKRIAEAYGVLVMSHESCRLHLKVGFAAAQRREDWCCRTL